MESTEELRHTIDVIDEKLFELLAKRMETVRKIGHVKLIKGIEVEDKIREENVRKRWQRLAFKHKLPNEGIQSLLDQILIISKEIQEGLQ